ncbi:MAG: squalene--hopene cyclase [Rhodospirillales bacterium RIFCSPLOWO2_12_FULL_67_15]|nr:MAG: squalene--hopene cyclase [Rhodospirillales bacterium RIFCSPLOWO2_12_FULL_67_15]
MHGTLPASTPESATQALTPEPEREALERALEESRAGLAGRQAADGHWLFELEADATIPAEFILLDHYLGEIDDAGESRLAVYLRRIQGAHGGWPLFHGGDFNISASVKAYYALKMVGDAIDAPHMRRARAAILAHGGAAKANVFTRIALALFEQVPWRATPLIRVEAMLLPKWFPFHIDKVSYWSRTVMVPLFVLATRKTRARNPRRVNIRELFVVPPEAERNYLANPTGHWIGDALLVLDRIGRFLEPLFPQWLEKRATARAMAFVRERLNGEDGLGGIFPAMANAVMAFDALGVPRNHPDVVTARGAIAKLLVQREDAGYCQPCVSPVWDTGLALHAMMEAGIRGDSGPVAKAARWLAERQILDVKGDWTSTRPDVRPGGWAVQYCNDHYPDVDDTAVVAMALHRADPEKYRDTIARAAEWVVGMQSANGGWGAFDADNTHYLLNHIPFADHGALLDPPTADVSARCIGFLAQIGMARAHPVMARALDYLRREQEPDGSWFGRWGTNYIYGTWSALAALNAAGEDMTAPHIHKAVAWLKSRQRDDGGWGEDCASYWPERKGEAKASTPSQTAWALLGLMAAGEAGCASVARGVRYLLAAPRTGGKWTEEHYNAVGFPRVFFLRYHGYSAYFPLWALARYRNLSAASRARPAFGI